MRKIKRTKPSPALLVAVVALVAALAGTAIGGVAVTSLSKKDKKQVTKIAKKQGKKQGKKQANKQIEQKAPGLSVAEADKLDGKDASELETSSGFAERTLGDSLILSTIFQDVAATTVESSAGRIVATGTAELAGGGGDDLGSCRLRIADGTSSEYDITPPDAPSVSDSATAAITFARSVSAGTYEVAFQCRAVIGAIVVPKGAVTAVSVGG